MKHWRDCDCQGAVFVKHIMTHLRVGDEVICKICNKTVAEIAKEYASQPAVQADAEKPCTFDHDKLLKHGSNYCNQCGAHIRTA